MKELLTARVRTLEIRSPNNFFALIEASSPEIRYFLLNPVHLIFVPGTSGLITSIRALEVITHRTIQSNEEYYEEREAQAARAQLQLIGLGPSEKDCIF